MTSAELDDRLAELLLAYNVVPKQHLERARAYQHAKQSTLAGALCDLHVLTSDTLRSLLEELTGVRAVDPSLMTVYPDFVLYIRTKLGLYNLFHQLGARVDCRRTVEPYR